VFMELRAFLSYRRRNEKLAYWRSQDRKEVDFILGDEWGVEVKSTKRLAKHDFSGIEALKNEKLIGKFCVVSRDPVDAKHGNVLCLHWRSFIERLWGGDMI